MWWWRNTTSGDVHIGCQTALHLHTLIFLSANQTCRRTNKSFMEAATFQIELIFLNRKKETVLHSARFLQTRQNIMKRSLQPFDSVKIQVSATVSNCATAEELKGSQRRRWISGFLPITPHKLPLVIYRRSLYRVVRQLVASRCLSYTGEPTCSTESSMSNFSFSSMSSEYIVLSERRSADKQIGSLLPSLWMRQSSLMDGAYHRSSHEGGWQ